MLQLRTRSAVKPDAVVFVYSACSVDRACAGRTGRRGWGALTTAGVLGSLPGGGLLIHTLEASPQTAGHGEGKCLLQVPCKKFWQRVFKRPELPGGFQGKVFKDAEVRRRFWVCGQLVDILLIGWWHGNWESTASTFWFQPA